MTLSPITPLFGRSANNDVAPPSHPYDATQ